MVATNDDLLKELISIRRLLSGLYAEKINDMEKIEFNSLRDK